MPTEMNFKVNIVPNQDNTYSLGTTTKKWKVNEKEVPTFDTIYPVGSIYMSINSTDPSILFGGTWEAIENTFLIAQGDTYTAGSSGGNATHSHTTDATTTGGTALSIANMPAHNHNSRSLSGQIIARKNNSSASFLWLPGGDSVTTNGIITRGRNAGSGAQYDSPSWGGSGYYDTYTINATHTHDTQGSGTAHTHTQNSTGTSSVSNLPPYLAVYMWKRTA